MSATYPDLSSTVFPDGGIDTFITWLDVTAQDGPVINEYLSAMNSGDYTLAQQILQTIPSYTQKIIKATDLNKLTQAMLALERFYKSDVKPYVENKQTEWETTINQFTYKKAYASGTTYQKNNMVDYIVSGTKNLYIAIDDVPAGINPTNTEYWRVVTVKGAQGESGAGTSFEMEWNAATQYSNNSVVYHNNAIWISKQSNQNQEPYEGSGFWEIMLKSGTATYPIQSTEPVGLEVNGLWFDTSSNPTQYYYLAPLTNPATASDIARGKQAYDAQGNLITGTK